MAGRLDVEYRAGGLVGTGVEKMTAHCIISVVLGALKDTYRH